MQRTCFSILSFTCMYICRCLTNANVNIAEFLGIHNAEMATPAFVYAGSLRSVRRLLNSFCCKRECVPEILEQTASALEYLHNKGMVHMELTQNTLTVSSVSHLILHTFPIHNNRYKYAFVIPFKIEYRRI